MLIHTMYLVAGITEPSFIPSHEVLLRSMILELVT